MQLKTYQQTSLDWLQAYLQTAMLRGASDAFRITRAKNPRPQLQRWPQTYQALDGLPDTPYVCLRLPTGGGKTLLCAHSIQRAAQALGRVLLLRADKWLRQQPGNAKPADRGEPFVVPQLCLTLDDIPLTLDAEHCLGLDGWNPLDYYRPISQEEFSVDKKAQVWIVDVEQERLRIRQRQTEQQLLLGGVPTHLDVTDLAVNMEFALFPKLQGQYMAEGALRQYLLKALQDLLRRDDMDLPLLIRARPILENLLTERLLAARKQAYDTAFQQQLLADDGRILVVEYKGGQFSGSDNTLEKTAVGKAWAKASGNLFLMAFKQDSQGRDVLAQLRQVLEQARNWATPDRHASAQP